ncbi:DUF1217 domain-containing protein [Rhodopila globiformis]|nr:DUF1217 domain-containing protein [Rhodopila globiformis]
MPIDGRNDRPSAIDPGGGSGEASCLPPENRDGRGNEGTITRGTNDSSRRPRVLQRSRPWRPVARMNPLVTSLGIPSGLAGWDLIKSKTPASFPSLTNDPVLKSQIAYFEANAPKATTAKALMSNPKLADFVLTAYGLTSESGMTALMVKVLNSNPKSSSSFAARMVKTQFIQVAADFNYGGSETPAKPATASSAAVDTSGLAAGSTFSNFSGTFGGVTLSSVNLSGATTWQGLASTLQTAFQRADGNQANITVKAVGANLVFTDAKGRGTAQSFAWSANPGNTGPAPTASSPNSLVAGSTATARVGGPSVTNPSFIQQVVQKYQEAQFQQVVGNTSNALRQALYAQQNLPSVTNWNQVIASPPLASVVQTLLGLPKSFGALNIQQQARVYGQRMNIANFQNPAKLASMLNEYVAMSSASSSSSSSSSSVAVQLLTTASSSSASDSYSSASIGALLMSGAVKG